MLVEGAGNRLDWAEDRLHSRIHRVPDKAAGNRPGIVVDIRPGVVATAVEAADKQVEVLEPAGRAPARGAEVVPVELVVRWLWHY